MIPAALLHLIGHYLGSPKLWAAGGIALLLAFGGCQTARLGHAKHDLAAARAALVDPVTHKKWADEARTATRDLTTCQADREAFRNAAAIQKAAVDRVKAESAARQAVSRKAIEGARGVAESYRRQAADIAATPTPPPDDRCEAALKLGRAK